MLLIRVSRAAAILPTPGQLPTLLDLARLIRGQHLLAGLHVG